MPDKFFNLAMGAYSRVQSLPMQPAQPSPPACHHCAYRLVGSESADATCLVCHLPVCPACLEQFGEVCPIDQGWNTNGGLPIGPKSAFDRGRVG